MRDARIFAESKVIVRVTEIEVIILDIRDPVNDLLSDIGRMWCHAGHTHLTAKIGFVAGIRGTDPDLLFTLVLGIAVSDLFEFLLTVFDRGDQAAMLGPEGRRGFEAVQRVVGFSGLVAQPGLFPHNHHVELVTVADGASGNLVLGVRDVVGDVSHELGVVAVDVQDLSESLPDLEGGLLGESDGPASLELQELSVEFQQFLARW